MSYLKTKVVFDDNGNSRTYYDYNKISSKIDFQPTNNKAEIIFNDVNQFYENGQFIIKENTKVIVYAKIVEDNENIDFTSDDIIFTGLFLEPQKNLSSDGYSIKFSIVDFGYKVFNRMFNKTYLDLNKKTNEILIDMLQNKSEYFNGLGKFELNFDNVASTRPNGSAFPIIEPTFTKQPVIDIIKELSSTQWTNTESEINTNTRACVKSMIFRIDDIYVKWYYPTEEFVLEINDTLQFLDIKETLNKEGSVNFLILECGEDLNGDVITTYIYDEKSGESPNITEQYQTYIKLAGRNLDYDNEYNALRAKYIALDDNNGFKKHIRKLAEAYSEIWFEDKRATTSISITLPLAIYNIGDFVKLNLPNFDNTTYSIESVSNNISEKDATTTLELKKVI